MVDRGSMVVVGGKARAPMDWRRGRGTEGREREVRNEQHERRKGKGGARERGLFACQAAI
jgi:hypothetical protein